MMCKQVMQKLQIIRLLLIALTLVFMTSGCGSDSGSKKTVIVAPGNLTHDASYFGSWISNDEDENCIFTFSDDGTFSIEGACGDFEINNGTWGIAEDGRMYMDSEGYYYAFVTSTGMLSLQNNSTSDIYGRVGNGTGLVGEWTNSLDGCSDTLTFTDAEFTYERTCADPAENENDEGTYTRDGDILTVNGGEDTVFFKIFNDSVLALDYLDELYSKQNE